MNHLAWHPIPGNPALQIYPIINEASYFLSNAYIIRMAGITVVIDPGDSPEQIRAIGHVLHEEEEPLTPVLVLLTHCHVDHCFEFLAAPALMAPDRHVLIAMQEEGIRALKTKDRELTGAGRFRKMVPDTEPEICLFSGDDKKSSSLKQISPQTGIVFNLKSHSITTSGDNTLFMQELSGPGFGITAYYAPGHSPDSIVLRVGDLLFTGDALLAAEHFIAGLPGWNKNNSLETAQNLLWLIENGGISMVAPGHGVFLTPGQAAGKLRKMISRLTTMDIQREFTLPFILESSEHAMDLASEAREIVSILSDSLSQAAHYLSILDEEGEANRYNTAINRTKFNDIFSTFNEIAGAMQSGRLLEMAMVHNSSTLFMKMRLLLKSFDMEEIVGQTLLNRFERLLSDFSDDTAGRQVQLKSAVIHTGPWLHKLISDIKKDVHTDGAIFDTLEDEKAFLQSLGKRFASRHIYRDVDIAFSPGNDLLMETDPERLAECLEIVFELMVEAGNRKIVIGASQSNPATVCISISGQQMPTALTSEGYQKRSLSRRLNWLRGSLALLPPLVMRPDNLLQNSTDPICLMNVIIPKKQK